TCFADDRPDVEVERLQHVVGIAVDVIFRRLAIVMAVADRVDLMDVVAHRGSPVIAVADLLRAPLNSDSLLASVASATTVPVSQLSQCPTPLDCTPIERQQNPDRLG